MKQGGGSPRLWFRAVRTTLLLVAFFAGTFQGRSIGAPPPASLVKDIYADPHPVSAYPFTVERFLGTSGGRLFFTAWSGPVTRMLWTSDGTKGGTGLLMDVYAEYGADVNGTFFFSSVSQERGSLWKSDGMTAGTVFVKRFSPDYQVEAHPRSLTKVGNFLFFVVDDGVHGAELWRSDGTEAGTDLVKDITAGSAGTFDYGAEFVDLNGTLVFTCGYTSQCGVWKSDGTEAGTMPISNVSFPSGLTVAEGAVYFSGTDAGHGAELWRTDGTAAGTGLVKDIAVGPVGSAPANLTALGGAVLFTPGSDNSLWRSDGTETGTVQVTTLTPTPPLIPANGFVFFVSGNQLWRTDGTAGGTFPVRDAVLVLYDAFAVPGALLFWAGDAAHGTELWRSDGTANGTVLVKDITPGPAGSTVGHPLFPGQGAPFFLLDQSSGGAALYRSDGTADGTVALADPVSFPKGSQPLWLTDANGILFFSADDGIHGYELWRSDGTADGTFMVRDINPGPGESGPRELVATPGFLFFVACEPATGCELWRSDGTEAGTRLVKDILAGPDNGYPSPMLSIGDVLLFAVDDGIHGLGVWRSDGTETGTSLLAPAPAGSFGFPRALGVLEGAAYFAAGNGASAILWKTDGTTLGTVPIGPVPDGTGWGGAVAGGVLVFSTSDAVNGTALWKTDGSAAGTTLVKAINPLPDQYLYGLISVGNQAVFWADDGVFGREPWITDGTSAGTKLLKDINPGPSSSAGGGSCLLGSTLFFFAYDGVHGFELWKTDGTEPGTVLVRDIAPGPAGSMFLENLAPAGGEIFFTASDHIHGREIWRSDGTSEGTVRVTDLLPGIPSGLLPAFYAVPVTRNLVRSGARVLFVADDGMTGWELWSLPIGLNFYTVPPCRAIDTRGPDGPAGGPAVGASEVRAFPLAGLCGIPSSASDVAANVTVVSPTGAGELSLFSGGPVLPDHGTFGFLAGKTRAHWLILSLGASGSFSIGSTMQSGGSTHVVVDVSGYFE